MFRFTIRDVLWLTLVVGLALGWWVDRESLAEYGREQATAAERHRQAAQNSHTREYLLQVRVTELERQVAQAAQP